MAEERLTDDDIDRNKKYRIRIGADGDKELLVDEQADAEEAVFEVPEELEDEEDEAKLAERKRQEEAAKLARRSEQLAAAYADVEGRRYSTALEHTAEAAKCGAPAAETGMLYMRAYTKDFTDFTNIVNAAEYAGDIAGTDSAVREDILARAGGKLQEGIKSLRASVTELDSQNQAAKAERAAHLMAERNKWLAVFIAIFVPFAACTVLGGYFASIMYSVSNGLYLILTIVFASLAVVLLVALAFAARKLITNIRRLRANGRNTSTKLGRKLLSEQALLRAYIAVYNALKG